MSASDDAYRAAEEAIAEAKREGATELSFDHPAFQALDRLPPEIAELTGLQSLYLTNTQVSDLAPLAALTGLQGLSLDNTQVSDLAPLAALTGLRGLKLIYTQVSDLTPLAALTGLQHLYLKNKLLSDLAPIAALTGLQSLNLTNTQVSDLAPLAALTGLQILDLSSTPVSDLTPLSALTGLHRLYLNNTQVSDLTHLAALIGLQSLRLNNTQVSDLTPLAALKGLQSLHLDNTRVSDLTPLAPFTGLLGLYLRGTQVSDLTPLAALTDLQDLNLSNTQINDLTPLAALAGLQNLYLDSTRISDLTHLVALTGLQTLDLDNTQVSDLTLITEFAGLQRLYLTNTQVSNVKPLAALTRLKSLYLNNTLVSDLTPLAALTGLQDLYLTNTQVSDLTPLAALTGLEDLLLNNTQVSDLRPLRKLENLREASVFGGTHFKNIPACADPKIAEIAAIQDDEVRVSALFALLDAGWEPPEIGAKNLEPAVQATDLESFDTPDHDLAESFDTERDPPSLPPRQPAPLEARIVADKLVLAGPPGLPVSDANERAAQGWEALKAYRESFGLGFSIHNYALLSEILRAFDAAMGDAYDPRRQIRIGVLGQRIRGVAGDAEFVNELPAGAGTDLRGLGVAIATYVNRFPDWREYEAEAAAFDAVSDAVKDEKEALDELSRVLDESDNVADEVKEEFRREVHDATATGAGEPEGVAVIASTREMTRTIAEHGLEQERKKREARGFSKRMEETGGKEWDKLIFWGGGFSVDLLRRSAPSLRRLSKRFPSLRFLDDVLDHWFGKE